MDPDNTASLTSALRAGDEAAWSAFHDTCYPRLFRWLLALSRGDEDASAEAAHTAFLRAVRRVPATGDANALWRWLTRLARSAYIDEWRRRRTRRSFLHRWLDSSEPPDLPSPDADPLEFLDGCLAALPTEDRLLLEEKYFLRQPVRMLAGERNLTEKALESRLTRARLRLRSALQNCMSHAD